MKKKISKHKNSVPSKELQAAFDLFPKIIKQKEKAAREKKRIMKNFMSVRDKIFKD
jgi:hypothetical protein